jgi:hypothetical protein
MDADAMPIQARSAPSAMARIIAFCCRLTSALVIAPATPAQ